MTNRFRFSLRFLLVATTLATLLFGLARWRRNAILLEAEAMRSQGFTLLWEERVTDWIWPVVPAAAKFEHYELADGKWRIGDSIYTVDEASKLYAKACDHLRALGVEEIRLDVNGEPGNSYTSTSCGDEPCAYE